MVRVFTSTPKPHRVAPVAFGSDGHPSVSAKPSGTKPSLRKTDKAGYRSFYNIQKTKLSARYPFLPNKQIERRIKQLWEDSSAEKRAAFCSSFAGTITAKSPFRGTILKGLVKKLRPKEQPPTLASSCVIREVQNSNHTPSSPLAFKGQSTSCIVRQGILSEKKRSMPRTRVSFRLLQDPMTSPISSDHHSSWSLNDPPIDKLPGTTMLGNGAEEDKAKAYVNKVAILSLKPEGTETVSGPAGTACRQLSSVQRVLSKDFEESPHLGDAGEDLSSAADVNVVEQAGGTNVGISTKASRNTGNSLQRYDGQTLSGGKKVPAESGADAPPVRQSCIEAAFAANARLTTPVPYNHRQDINRLENATQNRSQDAMSEVYRLKKTELSQEERGIYEFIDEDAIPDKPRQSITRDPSAGLTMTMTTRPRLKKVRAGPDAEDLEQYNLDSVANNTMFSPESQSSLFSPEQRLTGQRRGRGRPRKNAMTESSKAAKERDMPRAKGTRRRGRPRKSITGGSENDSNKETVRAQAVKRPRGRPRKSPKDPAVSNPSQVGLPKGEHKEINSVKVVLKRVEIKSAVSSEWNDCKGEDAEEEPDTNETTDVQEKVPWMVDACPPGSSSDDGESDRGNDMMCHHPLLQNGVGEEEDSCSLSTRGSPELFSDSQKICRNFESFCHNITSNDKDESSPQWSKGSSKHMFALEAPLADDWSSISSSLSPYETKVMSVSTECSASQDCHSPIPELPEDMMPSSFSSLASEGLIQCLTVGPNPCQIDNMRQFSLKRRMRCKDGELNDSSQMPKAVEDVREEEARKEAADRKTDVPLGSPKRKRQIMQKSQAMTNSTAIEEGRSYDVVKRVSSKDILGDGADMSKLQKGPLPSKANKPSQDSGTDLASHRRDIVKDSSGRVSNTFRPRPQRWKPDETDLQNRENEHVVIGKNSDAGDCHKKLSRPVLVESRQKHVNNLDGPEDDSSDNGMDQAAKDDGHDSVATSSSSGGLLCDLFQPCKPSSLGTNRLIRPSRQRTPTAGNDTSSYLFMEENFFT
ncbi:uncharacterized protein [Diadema setosum]|uniref:uncharacterized protein isoform X2 n=1 Tax=Diadema setosum TaxID=31175 RepID=UPI003B3BAED0